ncbi:MAG: AAA family ATPase, partial [Saprospiraceae bacterium]|nr:AAA family ATPase [Saprospiraceae bacterium]
MDNPQLHLAEQFLLFTRKNIFLTGKAGTGKTTFLKNALKKTAKNHVIVAPTGVAAINAGGVTIHSMFGFPLTAFTPDHQPTDHNIANNRPGLASHLKYNRDKLKLIRELDLLVIDEISMVRVDLLDAIDFALRRTRRIDQPFGNVQLLVIGDLFQLAPVVKHPIWHLLQKYYSSPYFFDAYSWKKSQPITIELTKIYRQSNQEFIDILNRMRYGQSTMQDLERLNQQYKPGFRPTDEKYITLTTHNYKADKINSDKMAELKSKSTSYSAEIINHFNANAYPAEDQLKLKVGAQVMFIRNDSEGKYFNGKLAEIISLSKEDVQVKFDNDETLFVEKVTWDNKHYELNKETNQIEGKVLGSFIQYPLRLAWAITVHKSQGLTFDRLIVDLGDSFASGQAYVALSRCTNLNGLVLLSRMELKNVMVNDEIRNYHDQAPRADQLNLILESAKLRFAGDELKSIFTFDKIEFLTQDWAEWLDQHEIPQVKKAHDLIDQIQEQLKDWHRINRSFKSELHYLIAQYPQNENSEKIHTRVNKAIDYYSKNLFELIVQPVSQHIESLAYKTKVKKYLAFMDEFLVEVWNQIDRLYDASFLGEKIYAGERKIDRNSLKNQRSKKKKKSEKGATLDDTLTLLKNGNSVTQIASIRSLTEGTIQTHLARLIGLKKINIYEIMTVDRVEKITFYMLKKNDLSLSQLKSEIPFEV